MAIFASADEPGRGGPPSLVVSVISAGRSPFRRLWESRYRQIVQVPRRE